MSATSNLDVQERVLGDTCLIAMAGDFDLFTAPDVRTRLDGLIDKEQRHVVVDLTRVRFMDSSGLAVLLDAWHSLGARHRRFRVVCPPGPVRTTLEITGLDEILPLYATREGALARCE
jgi:anti-sigma B factor antagonist